MRLCSALLAMVAGVAWSVGDARAEGVAAGAARRCTSTTVLHVTPRLQGTTFAQSGVMVTFDTHLGLAPTFPKEYAAIEHYQGDREDAVMAKEHRGDRVRLCLVSIPTASQTCNPTTDSRGRMFRVYDYRQNVWYSGMNSEHDCGGA